MPRSPSRDLSDRYIGKRGYFRNPEALRRGKYALAAAVFVGAVVWAGYDVAFPARAAYGHSHGPLANPHAAFDENCAACHVGQSLDFNPLAVFRTRDRWHDLSCGKCHAGQDDAGFAHHESTTDAAKEVHKRCSNCHHDHNGRQHSLIRLSDTDCTRCHSDLGKWHDPAKSKSDGTPYQNTITSFATDHPEFRSLDIAKQPRTLKFSHAVHMNPGQAYTPGGKEAVTPKRIAELSGEAAAARYRKPGQDDNTPVSLECASCHQLDPKTGTADFDKLKAALEQSGEPTRAMLPPRPEGAYFLPINYEVSCRACHPLTAPEGVSAGAVVPRFNVPHRRQPSELAPELKAGYVRGMVGTNHPALAVPPEPGGKLDIPPAAGNPAIGAEADRLAQAAERQLFSGEAGCAKCHTVTAPAAAADKFRIAAVRDRSVWFTHAKFNHSSHRGTTCATCHPGTGAATIAPDDANRPEPPQIRGVESCRACHSPAGTKVTLPDGSQVTGGGVRASCTDCHRYHHNDTPLQGRGSPARYPKDPRGLAEWLGGK